MNIDLHCHSTNSDGTWSVLEILQEAERKKVVGLCISDHDNFKGSLEAQDLANGIFSGTLIPGIEIATKVLDQSVHLLAYFPSFNLPEDSILFLNLQKIRKSRVWRMKEMLKKAEEKGMNITFDEVLNVAGSGMDGSKQPTDVLSRPHLARLLVMKGYATSFDEAFKQYLANGKVLHVAKFSLELAEWVDQVKELGGILVWAHPFVGFDNNLEIFANVLDKIGTTDLAGVELVYNYEGKYVVDQAFIDEAKPLVEQMVQDKNLIITSGGDFHGNTGVLGELDLEEEDWHQFLKLLNITKLDQVGEV